MIMEKETEQPKIVYCKICKEPYVVDEYYTKVRHWMSIQHLYNESEERKFNYGKFVSNTRDTSLNKEKEKSSNDSEENLDKSVKNDNIDLVAEEKITKKSANNGVPDGEKNIELSDDEDDEVIEVEKDKIITTEGNNENLNCDFDGCNFTANSHYILKVHKNAHKTCQYCDQKIFTEKNLIRHIKKYHITKCKKMHDCDICGETFNKKTRLSQHYFYCRKKAPFMNQIKQFQQNLNSISKRSSEKSTSENSEVTTENASNPLDVLQTKKLKKMRDCDLCGKTFPNGFSRHYKLCRKKAPFMNEIKQFQQNLNSISKVSCEKSTSENSEVPTENTLNPLDFLQVEETSESNIKSEPDDQVNIMKNLIEKSKNMGNNLRPLLPKPTPKPAIPKIPIPKNNEPSIIKNNAVLQCQFCELGFSKQDILDRHIRVMHEAAVLTKFHNFDSFSEAIQRNKIQSDLVHHINTGSDNVATNIMEDYSKSVILVPKQYKSESTIEKPAKSQSKIKIHSEGFAYCQFCEMKFEVDENSRKSKMIFLRHQEQCKETAHINLNLKSGKKSCPKCFKEFPPILFKAHVKSQHYLCEICMKWFSSLKSQKEHTATCKVEPEKIVEHQSEAIRRSFESSVNKISEGLAYCEFCEMSYEVNENYTISKHLKTLTHMNNVEKKNNSWSNSITSSRTKTEKIVEPNNFELGQQSEEILSDPLADDSMEISDSNSENIPSANHQSSSMLEVKDELLDTSETIYVKAEPLF